MQRALAGAIMGCLDDDSVMRFVAGRAPPADLPAIARHLNTCADCRLVVAETAKAVHGAEAAPADAAWPAPGTRVGRYEILSPVAAGAAGIVLRAYDPQLSRQVALKIVAVPPSNGAPDRGAAERLLDEARSMAQLSHPNIVAVHDAGTYDGQVFLAMEFVEGVTLADWLAAGRSWREIVGMFVEAGRGLAAAHAAGLVHRDFKPENVLIGADGRPRVTDFGLARPLGMSPRERAGTPAYMAPEQRRGGEVSSRSDQYSFCVALYAALYREHPGRTPDAPAAPTPQGTPAPAPAPQGAHGIPARLHRTLRRGLDPDPRCRYPSMEALLADLLAAGRANAARWVAAGLAVVALAAIGWWAAARKASVVAASSCGNGRVEPGEECDDGAAGETCNQACLACGPPGASFTWADNGSCYFVEETPLAWPAAQQNCVARGGHLVVYTSTPGARVVTQRLLANRPGPHWSGLRHDAKSGWSWSNGKPLVLLAYWYDAVGWPAGTCVAHERRIPTPDLPCDHPLPSICEKPAPARSPEGRTYRMFFDPVTWPDADGRCRALGGQLATILDQQEQQFVGSHFFGQYWIGLSRQAARAPFGWTTGEPLGYQAFLQGDPDLDGDMACVVLGDDRMWRDRDCADRHFFVCEFD